MASTKRCYLNNTMENEGGQGPESQVLAQVNLKVKNNMACLRVGQHGGLLNAKEKAGQEAIDEKATVRSWETKLEQLGGINHF